MPIHSRIYSFDQPFPITHTNQHPSNSEDDAPTLSKHQNPLAATSKHQPISTISFNAPTPQTTSSNINTLALHKAQNNRMSAVTGPAAMPAALSHHAPYFSGEGGESLDDFLHKYEELADGYGLMERQKVDWVIRYMAHSQQDLWKSMEGFMISDWNNLCNELHTGHIWRPRWSIDTPSRSSATLSTAHLR